MKKLRPGEMVQIKTVEELLGVVNEESAMDIEIYKIRSFQGHPFKVVDDEKSKEQKAIQNKLRWQRNLWGGIACGCVGVVVGAKIVNLIRHK